ncbi:MAG: hypothetical protein JKY93_13040 [Gammaproteobacteria bacterium]|nr:hypothetical protein [Gammaproteobacteria bacterium]
MATSDSVKNDSIANPQPPRSEDAWDLSDIGHLIPIQSISLALQDQVDALRNRSVINATVIGSAYSKWLSNPFMANEYRPIINEVQSTEESSRFRELNHSVDLFRKMKLAQRHSEGFLKEGDNSTPPKE